MANGNQYSLTKEGDWYVLNKGKRPLVTPGGRQVKTQYKIVADKLLEHLECYGEDPSNPLSIVAFQYPLIDFFLVNPRAQLERSVAIGLSRENDWTFNCPTANPGPMMEWMSLFGTYSNSAEAGLKWLSTMSLMQLCSVCVIGRVLESVNIPFIVATKVEKEYLPEFAKAVTKYYPYVNVKECCQYFDNFLLFYRAEEK